MSQLTLTENTRRVKAAVIFVGVLATDPGAIVSHSAASSQTGVEVGDAVGAADRSVLVDLAATVHVAASRQVPVGHCQGGTVQMEKVENM